MADYLKLDNEEPWDASNQNGQMDVSRRSTSTRSSRESLLGKMSHDISSTPDRSPVPPMEPFTVIDSLEGQYSSWASWFGGQGVRIGPRTMPVLPHLADEKVYGPSTDDLHHVGAIECHVAEEAGHAIRYRTCSWQKTTALMLSEYISLAALTFPWSYSVLGLVPGLMVTFLTAASVLYTSLIIWEFCLRHPEVRDISDIGQMLFWGKSWAWYATAAMFLLNNTFVQGIHIQMGADYLNTMLKGRQVLGCQTIVFALLVCVFCWVCSVPRTFQVLSKFAIVVTAATFMSILLATVFHVVQDGPAGYPDGSEDPRPVVTAWTVPGTSAVAMVTAMMNIAYLFIGQVTVPSLMAEMQEPRDFPVALWVCTVAELVIFSIVGAVIYAYSGNQYVVSPAFGSLTGSFKVISFSTLVPTIVFIGVLFASITARFIFFRLFHGSRHLHDHTFVGWSCWIGILLGTWIVAFLIAELVPFFSSLVALTSSLFDGFFGFIFWAVAYFRMRTVDARLRRPGSKRDWKTLCKHWAGSTVNVGLFVVGTMFLTVGTWASITSILDEFAAGKVDGVFSCKVVQL